MIAELFGADSADTAINLWSAAIGALIAFAGQFIMWLLNYGQRRTEERLQTEAIRAARQSTLIDRRITALQSMHTALQKLLDEPTVDQGLYSKMRDAFVFVPGDLSIEVSRVATETIRQKRSVGQVDAEHKQSIHSLQERIRESLDNL